MKDISIDLETLDTGADAHILAIGACEFDKESGKIGRDFYLRTKLISQGRSIGLDTVAWWVRQSEKPRTEIFDNDRPDQMFLDEVLTRFAIWCRMVDANSIWGNGSVFDIGILDNAYSRQGVGTSPWKYWEVRDMRTIVATCTEIKDIIPSTMTPIREDNYEHNALRDAVHQARVISEAWKALKGK